MTYEEAYEFGIMSLDYFEDCGNQNRNLEIQFYKMAVESFAKQIKKKLNKTDDHLYPISCPNCGCGFMDDVDYDCCPSCGQALDWSDADKDG